jgi:hypothetical protein
MKPWLHENSTDGDRLIGLVEEEGTDPLKIYVSVDLERKHCPRNTDGEWFKKETIDHKKLLEYFTLSISGKVVQGKHAVAFGQIRGDLDDITENLIGNTLDVLATLWDQYHLNDMQAGCIHQTPITEYLTHHEWKDRQQAETDKCPEGYRYGSAWLLKPIPDRDMIRIHDAIAVLRTMPKF